jgi:hypothetical protein
LPSSMPRHRRSGRPGLSVSTNRSVAAARCKTPTHLVEHRHSQCTYELAKRVLQAVAVCPPPPLGTARPTAHSVAAQRCTGRMHNSCLSLACCGCGCVYVAEGLLWTSAGMRDGNKECLRRHGESNLYPSSNVLGLRLAAILCMIC